MARTVKKRATPLAAAKRKIAAAKKANSKTKQEWAKVIKTAESVLKSAGVDGRTRRP